MQHRPDDRKEVVRVAPKVVSLHVHKNTMARRKRHELARALIDTAKLLAEGKDVEAFAVVVLKSGTAETMVNNGDLDEDLFWVKIRKELRACADQEIEGEEDTAG